MPKESDLEGYDSHGRRPAAEIPKWVFSLAPSSHVPVVWIIGLMANVGRQTSRDNEAYIGGKRGVKFAFTLACIFLVLHFPSTPYFPSTRSEFNRFGFIEWKLVHSAPA